MELRKPLERRGPAGPQLSGDGAARSGAHALHDHGEEISPNRLRAGLILSDVVAIAVGVTLAALVQRRFRPDTVNGPVESLALYVALVPIWLGAMSTMRLFMARAVVNQVEEARRIFAAVALGLGATIALAFVVGYGGLSRTNVVLLFAFVSGSLLISRSFARSTFQKLRRRGRICRRVVIVGTGADAVALFDTTVRRPDLGYCVVGFTGDASAVARRGVQVLGPVDQTLSVTEATGASGVILSVASLDSETVNRLTRTLAKEGLHVTLSSTLRDIDLSRARPQALDGQLMIYVEPTNTTRTRLFFKRLFDVTVSSLVLLLTAPITAVAAIAIKVESGGPVLFSQVRVGRNGETFRILKLRTMVVDAEAMRADLLDQNEVDGPLFKIRNDPRVTRVGRFLRKTSIDELPQLWNVLRNEMSIVGPRPALPDEAAQWSDALQERLTVLPGITGLWQVSGRSDSDFDQYQRLDLYYVDNWSLLHDLKIVARTFSVVVFRSGAH
jgi:exopolysaccharide biosynthesis polyprenyl glycosylphosphotransferase